MLLVNTKNNWFERTHRTTIYGTQSTPIPLWNHATVSSIPWRSLKVALRWIHRPSLCTKVCSDLLPTNQILYRWGHQGNDSCPLCDLLEETTEHMVLCGHSSRLKLWWKHIWLLQTRMQQFGTSAGMKDTLCSTLSDLFDDNSIDPSQYPFKYTAAIESQNAIGWNHLFMGHFFTEWATSQKKVQNPLNPRKLFLPASCTFLGSI